MKQLVLKKQIFCDDGMRSDEITERRRCNCPSKTSGQLKVMVQEIKKIEEEQ